MTVPRPANEQDRLLALRALAILDTPDEESFDRITRLAQRVLKVAVAMTTFLDEKRQWFKSVCGWSGREADRDTSFCAHAIMGDDVLVVPDARNDPRFRDSPFVAGPPGVRFYAGSPICAGGLRVGTLCVLDLQPRELTDAERETLADLAALVNDALELRLIAREHAVQSAAIFHVRSGVVMTNPRLPDNPIVFANPAFWEMVQHPPEEILGQNCRFLQGPNTNLETLQQIRDAIAARQSFEGEILNYRRDGSQFWNELTVSPVFDDVGELISFIGLQHDVTERKESSEKLKDSFKRLQELETLRDNLTNMIVHDLRSPLTIVLGYLGMIHRSESLLSDRKLADLVGKAESGARALREMITSLLDVHRLESGEMPLRVELVDLCELIKSSADPYFLISDDRKLTLKVPTRNIPVSCDVELIRRVIANLLTNALKFTPKGGAVEIEVITMPEVAVSVSDSGPGIPVESQTKIFDKFCQIGKRGSRHSTGLGLTFCKLAVEAHGGTIGVESRPGSGARFWFRLPDKFHDP